MKTITRHQMRENAFLLVFEKNFSDDSVEEILDTARECDAIEVTDQVEEMFRGVVAVDVQRFDLDLFGSLCPECVEGLPAASRRSDPPSLADAEPCRFEPDARRGSYDDDAFHSGSIFRISPSQYTKGMPEKQIFGQMKKSSGESSLSRYRFLLGFGFSRSGGASSAARCSAVSRAGAMRRR